MHHLQRQHARRQTAPASGTGTSTELREQRLASFAVMKQQQGITATGLGIGTEQFANARSQIGHGR